MGRTVTEDKEFEKITEKHYTLKALAGDELQSIEVEDIYFTIVEPAKRVSYVKFTVESVTGFLEIKDDGITDESGFNLFTDCFNPDAKSFEDIKNSKVDCNFSSDLEICTLTASGAEVNVLFELPGRAKSLDEMENKERIWNYSKFKRQYLIEKENNEVGWEVRIEHVTGVPNTEDEVFEITTVSKVDGISFQLKLPKTQDETALVNNFIDTVGGGGIELVEDSYVYLVPESEIDRDFEKGFTDETDSWRLLTEDWYTEFKSHEPNLRTTKNTKNPNYTRPKQNKWPQLLGASIMLSFTAYGIETVIQPNLTPQDLATYSEVMPLLEVFTGVFYSLAFINLVVCILYFSRNLLKNAFSQSNR